jgi:tetratricopeptide (TPR) repeat protein
MRRLLLFAPALACSAAALAQAPALPPGTTSADAAARQSATVANSPLEQAEEKLADGNLTAARALLTPYLAAHTGDARGWYDLGYIEDADNNTAAAEADYRKALAADPKQFEAHLALGLLLAHRGDTAGATEQLQAATTLTPNPPNPAAQAQAFRAVARLLAHSNPAAARDALLSALKLSPETSADTLLTAEIAQAAGDDSTAQQAYTQAGATAVPGSDAALQATNGLAHQLIVNKQYPEAELLLRKALAKNSGDPTLNAQLAQVLVEQGKRDDAIAVLENLHAAQPDEQSVTRMLAGLYTDAGQPAKADPLYSQLLRSTANPDPALLAAGGDNLVRQGRYAEAIPLLQRATTLAPADGNSWSSLAFAASEAHQPQLVLDALAMRSKVMSDTPATYFLRATAYDTLHQTRMAVEMYKQFLAVAGGKFPDQEWQARHRLVALAH